MRGPNRCQSCLTEKSLFSLESLSARHPEITHFSDHGRCDRCGSMAEVFDMPLLLILSARGLLKRDRLEDRPRFRLRQSNWVDERRRPLSLAGIRASLSEPAQGGVAAVLLIGRA